MRAPNRPGERTFASSEGKGPTGETHRTSQAPVLTREHQVNQVHIWVCRPFGRKAEVSCGEKACLVAMGCSKCCSWQSNMVCSCDRRLTHVSDPTPVYRSIVCPPCTGHCGCHLPSNRGCHPPHPATSYRIHDDELKIP